jgi:hypothetical protein
MQPLRGPREIACFRNGHEVAQLAQFHYS